MEMDEYNSNNEAGFGTDLKVKLKNKEKQIIQKRVNFIILMIKQIFAESLEIGSMLVKMGKQPERLECYQEQNDRSMCKYENLFLLLFLCTK